MTYNNTTECYKEASCQSHILCQEVINGLLHSASSKHLSQGLFHAVSTETASSTGAKQVD